jgi:hypothetical protein
MQLYFCVYFKDGHGHSSYQNVSNVSCTTRTFYCFIHVKSGDVYSYHRPLKVSSAYLFITCTICSTMATLNQCSIVVLERLRVTQVRSFYLWNMKVCYSVRNNAHLDLLLTNTRFRCKIFNNTVTFDHVIHRSVNPYPANVENRVSS